MYMIIRWQGNTTQQKGQVYVPQVKPLDKVLIFYKHSYITLQTLFIESTVQPWSPWRGHEKYDEGIREREWGKLRLMIIERGAGVTLTIESDCWAQGDGAIHFQGAPSLRKNFQHHISFHYVLTYTCTPVISFAVSKFCVNNWLPFPWLVWTLCKFEMLWTSSFRVK